MSTSFPKAGILHTTNTKDAKYGPKFGLNLKKVRLA